MLKSLSYSVTFPSTGRTLSGQFDFETGFGAIVGPNEAGKSMIVEMIRYCLFGTNALRGAATDYKNLKADFSFKLRGHDYRIVRSGSPKMYKDGDIIAVGIKPINEKVVKELGFGLDVFDTACVANQGDIEKLGEMRPGDRKRMVDSVIGLGAIEELAKWCGEESLNALRTAEGMEKAVYEPAEPVKPEAYEPAADLQPKVVELLGAKSELDQIEGWLSTGLAEPEQPVCDVENSVEFLTEKAAHQKELQNQLRDAKRDLAKLPAAPAEEIDVIAERQAIDAYEAWREREVFLQEHPTPSLSPTELTKLGANVELWDLYQEMDRASAAVDHLMAEGEHTCPKCEHTWPVAAGDRMEQAWARLRAAEAAVEGTRRPMEPDEDQIRRERRRHQDWIEHKDEWSGLVDVPEAPNPTYTVRQLRQYEDAVSLQEQRPALEAKIAELDVDMPDYQALLLKRQAYEDRLTIYEDQVQAYHRWVVQKGEKEQRRKELRKSTEALPELQERLQAAQIYEHALGAYTEQKVRYDATVEEAAVLRHLSEEWKKAKQAMVTLRSLVKQHLVPSLNKVASHLIKQMTGGQRQSIVVDEEFDVTVDGQPLNTLSGSGKAVANLALRLGLGQVLTNNVFSLFMGDEIDASMDKDRAENTANALVNLKERISQILLVTHKFPEADYYIELGKQSEQNSGTVAH